MQLLTPADAAGHVTSALKSAAQATGAGFDYLLRTAKRESSLDPSAQAPTSSARGLFQFIDQTWLQTLKQDGPSLGLAAQAADVTRTASGRYVVADPERRSELLALRDDPQTSALLAGAFTRRNAATLRSALGRPATDGELYAAHFLGPQGAVDLVTLAQRQPNASAAAAFPAQAATNRAIFYESGRPRSVGEVYARLTAVEAGAPAAGGAALALQAAGDDADYGPFRKGVEDDSRAFHSLFQTGRRTPVSSYVTQAWAGAGAANGLAADLGAAAPRRPVAAAVAIPVTQVTLAPGATATTPVTPAATAAAAPAATARASRRAAVAAAVAAPLDLMSFRRPDPPTPPDPAAAGAAPKRTTLR